MANVKISDLTDETAVQSADRMLLYDASGSGTQWKAVSCQKVVERAHADLGITPQNRISTTTDPGVDDDGAGTNGVNHLVNDLWTNTATDTSWICQDITTGAAVWTQIDGGGASDHGALTGLADDDHTQYLLVAGTRAMTGDLDMGTNAITNVGNVDGVDISSLVSLTIANLRSVIGGLTDTQGATADRFVYWDADGTLQQCSHQDIVAQAHSDLGIVPQNRISTTTDPGANDDGAGTNGVNHLVNDLWTNTTDDTSWICVDTTTTAAVWKPIASTTSGAGTPTATATVPDFIGQVYIDTSAEDVYVAIDTAAASDFVQVDAAGGGTDVNVLSVEKNTAGTINKGQVVYIAGYDTDKPTVELADADDTATIPPVGVANASITDSTAGDIVVSGIIDGMDTSSFSAGDNVYLDTTAGALVATRPDEEFVYRIGQVIYSHASNGVLRVNIERVKGRYWLYGNWDGKVNTASSLDNYVTCPATGTIESCEVTFAKFLSGSDGANYWSFDVQNASQSDRSALAAAYDATTDPTWKAWQDLGALNATAANKEVAEGDIINLEIVETGTPPTLGGNSILLRIKILPAN